MKIFQNIPAAVKLYSALRFFNKYKKLIESAKNKNDYEQERIYIQKAEMNWSEQVMRIFGAEVIVHGKENLPKEGPVVFIGNHQGYADIFAYFSALSPSLAYGYVAKDDLGKIPFYGKWIVRIRSVLIKRNDPRASMRAIDEGIDLIKKGFSLMIFPEGTRSKGPNPGSFKRGAFKLATKPQVPIIPVSLNGSYKMYEETEIMKGARIDIMVHPAVDTKGLSRQEEKEICLNVEKTIKEGIIQLQNIQDSIQK